jgi:WD40 repeat protein
MPMSKNSVKIESNAATKWTALRWNLKVAANLPLLSPNKISRPLIITLFAEILDVLVIFRVTFSPDGFNLSIGSDKTMRISKIGKEDFIFQHTLDESDDQKTNHLRSIVGTNDNQKVLCDGEDGKVRIFSVFESVLLHAIEVEAGEVFQVVISNNDPFCDCFW